MKLPQELLDINDSFLLPGTILRFNIQDLKLKHQKYYIIVTEVIDGNIYGLLINSNIPDWDKQNSQKVNNYICISKSDYSFLGNSYSFINCNKLIRVSKDEIQSKLDGEVKILSVGLTKNHCDEIIIKFKKGIPEIEPKLAKAVIAALEKI
jgi:hypothetical protein